MKKVIHFSGNKLRGLRNCAVTVMIGIFGTTAAFGQIYSPKQIGSAGNGVIWEYHPDDQTVYFYCGGIYADPYADTYEWIQDNWVDICLPKDRNKVKTVMVKNGVKGIGESAFHDMSALENVLLISGSLEEIKPKAFERTAITTIIFPQNLTAVGENAFNGCNNLTNIVATRREGFPGYIYMLPRKFFFEEIPKALYLRDSSTDSDVYKAYFGHCIWGCNAYNASWYHSDIPQSGAAWIDYFFEFDANPFCDNWCWFYAVAHYTNFVGGQPFFYLPHTILDIADPEEIITESPIYRERELVITHKEKRPSAQARAKISPSWATDTYIWWDSSDTSVAHVSATGQIFGINPGKATIKAVMHCFGEGAIDKPWSYISYEIKVRNIGTDSRLTGINVVLNNGKTYNVQCIDNVQDYIIYIPDSVTVVKELTPILAEEHATTVMQWSSVLTERNTLYKIYVSAEDELSLKAYNVTIRRSNSDASLSSIKVNGKLVTEFNSALTEYTEIVNSNVNRANITAVTNSPAATVTVKGADTLGYGNNHYYITVVSDDKTVLKTYWLTIRRSVGRTDLSSISIDGTALQGFDPEVTEYTFLVSTGVNRISITAKPTYQGTEVLYEVPEVLLIGNNICSIKVVSDDKTSVTTYKINVKRLSGNAVLSDIFIDESLIPGFNPYITDYRQVVSPDVRTVTVTPQSAYPGTEILAETPDTLVFGDNIFSFTVIPEDKSDTVIYKVNIRRSSGDAMLSALSINGTPLSDFNPAVTEYRYSIGHGENLKIDAASANPAATVLMEIPPLVVGDNDIIIKVQSEDGSRSTVYRLTVRQLSNDILLNGISINGKSVSKFNPNITEYEETVTGEVTGVTITGEVYHPGAVVTVEGPNLLAVGNNVFTLTIFAEDVTFKKTYTITIIRNLSDDATLEILSVDGITLSPSFHPNIHEYRVQLENSIDNIVVSALTANPGAIALGTGKLSIPAGNSAVDIEVIAEDAVTRLHYLIFITREAAIEIHSKAALPEIATAVRVSLNGQTLHVSSPADEEVSVYSVTGILLGKWNTSAGDASFIINSANNSAGSLAGQLLIVKGSSGWVRKTVTEERRRVVDMFQQKPDGYPPVYSWGYPMALLCTLPVE
jgi:hypothetical protein